jgi:hypothetical protein
MRSAEAVDGGNKKPAGPRRVRKELCVYLVPDIRLRAAARLAGIIAVTIARSHAGFSAWCSTRAVAFENMTRGHSAFARRVSTAQSARKK